MAKAKKDETYKFLRSGTVVHVTKVNDDGTFDVEETSSQGFTGKTPIPVRFWAGVAADQLVEPDKPAK